MEVDAPPSGGASFPGEDPDDHARRRSELAAQVEAIEGARRRLARSLNDGPSQMLSNIVLRAENLERLLASDLEQAREESRHLRETAVSALAAIRRFMFEAYPSVLEDLGLVQTLRRYLQSRGADPPPVTLRVEGEERRLVSAAELALFRAAQQAIATADRDAASAGATLVIAFQASAVELTASGVRFGASDEEGRAGVAAPSALSGLRAQLGAIDGELRIQRASDGGAGTLTAHLPV